MRAFCIYSRDSINADCTTPNKNRTYLWCLESSLGQSSRVTDTNMIRDDVRKVHARVLDWIKYAACFCSNGPNFRSGDGEIEDVSSVSGQ